MNDPIIEKKALAGAVRQAAVSFGTERTRSSFEALNGHLKRIEKAFPGSSSMDAMIRMIRSLAGYLQKKGTKSHPEATALLSLIVEKLAGIVAGDTGHGMERMAKSAATEALKRFNAFKKAIAAPAIARKSKAPGLPPPDLSGIKAALLSLDWEISDSGIHALLTEVKKAGSPWKKTTVYGSFFQMMQSLARYVGARKETAHKDAVRLLHDLFESLESMVRDSMSPEQKKAVLERCVRRYKTIKKQIQYTGKAAQNAGAEGETLEFIVSEPDRGGGEHPGAMDDLISTRSETGSPVDGMMDEIHLLNVFGDEGGAEAAESAPQAAGVRELRPVRKTLKPIQEIEQRLDSFFDEDDALSSFDFSDTGDSVVPYETGQADPEDGFFDGGITETSGTEPSDAALEEDTPPLAFDDDDKDAYPMATSELPEETGSDAIDFIALKSLARSLETWQGDERSGEAADLVTRLKKDWKDWAEGLVCLEMVEAGMRALNRCPEPRISDVRKRVTDMIDALPGGNMEKGFHNDAGTPWLPDVVSRFVEFHRVCLMSFSALDPLPAGDDSPAPGPESETVQAQPQTTDSETSDSGSRLRKLFGFGRKSS